MLAATTLSALLITVGGCASQPTPRASIPSASMMTAASGATTIDATTMRQRWMLFGAKQVSSNGACGPGA